MRVLRRPAATVLKRIWALLDKSERRRLGWLAPLLVVSAFSEVVGVAAVIPFLSILTDPEAVGGIPVVGDLVAALEIEDRGLLLRYAAIALASAVFLANGLVLITHYWLFRFSWALNHTLSARLLSDYLARPYAFILTRNSSAIANTVIVEVQRVVQAGLQSGLEILTRTVITLALVGFLVVLDPVLAVTVFVFLGLAYTLIFGISRRFLLRWGRELVDAAGERLKAVNEALGAFKILRVRGHETSALRQYLTPSKRYAEVQAAIQAATALPRYGLEAIAVGGMVLIAALLGTREGTLVDTLPLLGAYAFAGLRLLPAMQQAFTAMSRLRSVTGSLEVVEADLTHERGVRERLGVQSSPPPFREEVTFSDVTYAYPSGEGKALQDVSFVVRRGRSLAVVGGTGAGKSTLVDILLGLLEPERGSIAVDGLAIDAGNRRAYRHLFGYVPQDIFLLDTTIRRNVAVGLDEHDIDDDAVRRACAQAQVADLIEHELADGYETVVGERGIRLSGGQRQRIGIARALYHQPPILIFDEATSALDVHTERRVYEALAAIARDRTLVTIAHRLETVANADHVLVLENGRVVDEGVPEQVLGRYRERLPV